MATGCPRVTNVALSMSPVSPVFHTEATVSIGLKNFGMNKEG